MVTRSVSSMILKGEIGVKLPKLPYTQSIKGLSTGYPQAPGAPAGQTPQTPLSTKVRDVNLTRSFPGPPAARRNSPNSQTTLVKCDDYCPNRPGSQDFRICCE